MLTWAEAPRALECRVCGIAGAATMIVTITALDEVGLEAIRCASCGSIQLVDEPRDFAPTNASIDAYVESGAGIGAIAAVFSGLDHARDLRFLDVGCSYPFALDLARFLYRWNVVGVEPSPAGRRGGRELGVDVRGEYLTPTSTVGDGFDVILASEVVEHVTDPLEFLSTIRARLSPRGSLVMTTPAAEIVSPLEARNEVLLALSPGYHVFLASVAGMETLLARAGFASWSVIRDGGSLRVTAHATDEPRGATSTAPVSLDDLERYYDWRGRRSPARSMLALGLVTRLFRLRVARGDFSGARRTLRRLYRSARAVHGVDLRKPETGFSTSQIAAQPPWSIAGASFALGMYELLYRGRSPRAVSYFELSELVARAAHAQANFVDGDTADLMFQAPYHRAIALARFRPDDAAALGMELTTMLDPTAPRRAEFLASRQCRIWTELVANGSYPVDSALASAVAETSVRLARDADDDFRVAGLDALYSLGIAALNTGAAGSAAEWFDSCVAACLTAPASAHTTNLIMSARRHRELAHERAAPPSPRPAQHSPTTESS
jgi:SAM-dependent methyltransferase